jgi:nucleoside-diphosphate-sugar epimerase
MKILLIGAAGTIGSAVDKELSQRHEVIRIGRSGDFQVDISDSPHRFANCSSKPASSTR